MAWGLRLARRKADAIRETSEPEFVHAVEAPMVLPEPAPVAERGTPPLHAVGGNLNTVRQKLLDLYGQHIPRDEFAAQAVQLIVRALGAVGAALLAYEQRRDRVVLVAATGLSREACQVLGGGHGGPSWDIPIRGLANRRISVIEAAHQNPFVPRPLIEISPRRLIIASLPFFHGYARSGVLVLFANKPHGFSDAQLQALGQTLKVCALAFAELPLAVMTESVPGAIVPPETPPVLADRQRAADAEELARLRSAFDEALWRHAKELAEARRAAADALDVERERFAAVGATLAGLEAERDRLAMQLATARGDLAALADTRAALESRDAETSRLQDALAAATSEVDRSTRRLTELQQAHGELAARHETALRLQAEQTAASAIERDQATTAISTLRERLGALEADHSALQATSDELRATHENMVVQLDAVQARAAALHEQLAAEGANRALLEGQQAELRSAYEAVLHRAADAEHVSGRLQQQLAEREAVLRREGDALREELGRALANADALGRALAETQEEGGTQAVAAKLAATRLAQVEQALMELRAEHVAALADAQNERQRLTGELRVWGEREPAWAAQLAQITARANAVEAERARLDEALTQLEHTHRQTQEGAAHQLQALEETAQHLRDQHTELQARHGAITAAHAALQSDRDQLEALCASLRREQQDTLAEHHDAVAGHERQIADLQSRLRDAVAQYERDTGERSSYVEQLAHERDALVAVRRDLESTLTERTARAQRLEAELAVATAQEAELRTQLEQANAQHEQDTAALRQQLGDAQVALDTARRERNDIAAAQAAATAAATLLERDVAQLRADLAAAADTLAHHRAEASAAEAERRAELAALQGELAATQQRIAERDAELAALRTHASELVTATEQERAEHSNDVDRLTREWDGERAALRARTEELEAEIERIRKEHMALAEALAVDESQPALEIERCVMPGGEELGEPVFDDLLAASTDLPFEEPTLNSVAVIDGELGTAMVAALTTAGWNAVACAPTDDAVDELATRRLSGIAINVMAGANGWQLIRRLRERAETRSVPLLLYAKPSEGAGFCFGPTDCVLWPTEPQRLLDAVARLAPRAKRVLAMSTDIDIVAGVREQLTGAGLSAAVMLDGKQALDLLPSVRPDAVVLHFSPSCVDVFRTISGLRANGHANLPVVLILDREPSSRDATFLAGGTRTLANKGTFGVAGIVDALNNVLPPEPNGATSARSPEPTPSSSKPRASVGHVDGWVG